jgi:hypothetical protein
MTLAVTLMIRDEADILPAWLDYHRAQGIDVFIITDNGSVDGSTELLEAFAARDDVVVDLRHDPVHRKQQGTVVTGMARDAATQHGATWVVNADADEFLIPVDRTRTLREVFAALDPVIGAFTVPVVNLVGRLAKTGSGLERLHWRDERSVEELRAVGLLAQPTTNAIHVADPEVNVVQGNHQVSVANGGEVPEDLRLEVLHLPWRSVAQYAHRVETTGRAYDANPDLTPSPNHHGMRDWRRFTEGILDATFSLRNPTEPEAEAGPFRRETALVDFLAAHELQPATVPDRVVPAAEVARLRAIGAAVVSRDVALSDALAERDAAREDVRLLEGTIRHLEGLVAEAEARDAEYERFRNRRSVRMLTGVADRVPRLR